MCSLLFPPYVPLALTLSSHIALLSAKKKKNSEAVYFIVNLIVILLISGMLPGWTFAQIKRKYVYKSRLTAVPLSGCWWRACFLSENPVNYWWRHSCISSADGNHISSKPDHVFLMLPQNHLFRGEGAAAGGGARESTQLSIRRHTLICLLTQLIARTPVWISDPAFAQMD